METSKRALLSTMTKSKNPTGESAIHRQPSLRADLLNEEVLKAAACGKEEAEKEADREAPVSLSPSGRGKVPPDRESEGGATS